METGLTREQAGPPGRAEDVRYLDRGSHRMTTSSNNRPSRVKFIACKLFFKKARLSEKRGSGDCVSAARCPPRRATPGASLCALRSRQSRWGFRRQLRPALPWLCREMLDHACSWSRSHGGQCLPVSSLTTSGLSGLGVGVCVFLGNGAASLPNSYLWSLKDQLTRIEISFDSEMPPKLQVRVPSVQHGRLKIVSVFSSVP